MSTIYERIEQVIETSGLTKKDFVQKVGISTGNLGDWKSGKSMPSASALIRIAEQFDVSLDWLMLGQRKTDGEMREGGAAYFFEQKWKLNYRKAKSLSDDEHQFIKEYIDFAHHRKKKQ